ncbi:MAG: hypothetical protein M3483_08250 [Gemmatimonadota bacterium]|nr:hypothetical protein [Gemmatimonadota bacterium]
MRCCPLVKAAIVLACYAAAPAFSAAAEAQSLEDYDYENLRFRGIGMEVGPLFLANMDRTFLVGARVDLGYLGPHIRLVPGGSFWSSRLAESEVRDLRENILRLCREPESDCLVELGEIRLSNLALNLDAHYTWPLGYGVTPYAGTGISLHLLNGRGDFIDDTFVEDLLDAVAPGVSLIGGIEIPLAASLLLFTEGRATLASDIRSLGVSVGGSWFFPLTPAAADRR